MSLDLQTRADGVVLKIRAVAGASRDRVVGLHGGALKLATTAAPEKGKATSRPALKLISSHADAQSSDLSTTPMALTCSSASIRQ